MHFARQFLRFFAWLLVCVTALGLPFRSRADSAYAPAFADTPYDLINAVNNLRLANGLPPYSVNSILMYTAQAQAEFMAATGMVTHSGPGGISLTDRLLAAGYPLAGDLSQGGFRAENIISGSEEMSAQEAVQAWTGDAPHLNTMLSPNLTEIGAGVAVANGRVYYVIDCARPTSSGLPQAYTPAPGGGSSVPGNEAPISPVVVSTPNANGDVIHEVLWGQTLWQIAIAYGVRIDDIRRLNNLSGDDIYPGNKLLIKKNVIQPTASPVPTVEVVATHSPTVAVVTLTSPSLTVSAPSPTPLPSPAASAPNTASIMGIAIGILVLALLGGGLFTWLGNSKKA
ncbi:MAG TPA: CAP domain-containing protein [Anaerolineales bacterium]|nr:CAP domain-containing protein [Anaerolineales bacterium]